MPFDPVTWALGYVASQGASMLLKRIFDMGAYDEIQAAAVKWSSNLPEEIRTPSEALLEIDPAEFEEASVSRNKLKRTILELHNVPTEEEWFDALIEAWEFKRNELGPDANTFFQLEKSVAEEHIRKLAAAIFAACAAVLKYSQPLIIKAVREIGITQSAILREIRSFRSPLNNQSAERNEAITLNFDPLHIEEGQLHLLNEVLCVDSPAEMIAGRYRTHEIWIGPDGSGKEDATYIPLQPQYIEDRMKHTLNHWNRTAVDLSKLQSYSVVSAIASFHHKFLEIHPYPDGNGRVARAILDLHVRNFTSARSPLRLKSYDEYYLALRAADDGDLTPLIALIGSILEKDLGEDLELEGVQRTRLRRRPP
jgi:fido (protein-threonine AMPylation protein)